METLRKQTKRLLAKSNLRSQVELACIYPLCTVEDFAKTQAGFKLVSVPNAGQLVWYQTYTTVFAELDKQFCEPEI